MDSPPKFSILCATVQNRCDLFAKLHAELKRQADGKPVEIVVACDAKEISIGKKRQNLLEAAKGDWIAFVDDDDWISQNYVDKILTALEQNPDCVGFKIECSFNGGPPQKAVTSIRYLRWAEDRDGYKFVRGIYHKSVVRRSISLGVGFLDLRYGEDRPHSEGLMRLVKKEAFVDAVLYYYRYHREPFGKKYGIVGPWSAPRKPRVVERLPQPPRKTSRDDLSNAKVQRMDNR